MNIFYTNECPIQSALDHNKVHQIKQILEFAQMLSTAHSVLDGTITEYKPTHPQHPSSVWIRSSVEHYNWSVKCALHLCKLYTESTGKIHATQRVLEQLSTPPRNIVTTKFKEPPVAAPDEFKAISIFQSATVAYQKYLCSKYKEWQQRDKPMRVEWSHRVPSWYVNN